MGASNAAAASTPAASGRRWLEAARAGELSVLQQMLPSSPGLWAHRGSGLGHTAAHWAAARDDTAMLQWLLARPGAEVGVRNNVGATALHAAAGNDAVASLQVLVAAGADLLARDEGEETARDVAKRLNRAAALAFLDAAAGKPSGLHAATPNASTLRIPEPPPTPGEVPVAGVACATRGLQAPTQEAALESPVLPASDGTAAVAPPPSACATLEAPPAVGHVEKELGRRWLDAARSGDVRTLLELLGSEPRLLYYWGAGTNFGFSGHSALHWTAAKGHAEALQALLRAGASPDMPNHGGGRPLHAAAANGQTQCARMLLLQGGACASLRNGLEETPRELALQSGHADTAHAIEEAARAAELRDVLSAESLDFRGGAVRAAQAALAASGHDLRAFTERNDLLAAAKQLVASLPPLLRTERVAVPTPAPAPSVIAAPVAVCPTSEHAASPGSDSDEADIDSAERSRCAEAAKARGNAAFVAKEHGRAAAAYTVALRFDRGNAVLLSNRSAALAALGKYADALEDADRAVRAAPKWGKGHARRGAALIGLGQAGEAVKAYAAGLAVEPDAAFLRKGLNEAKQAIRDAQARYSAMWGDASTAREV